MFTIEGYSYSTDAILRVRKGLPLDLDVLDYQPLTLRQYILMRKSLALAARLYKAAGAPEGITAAHEAKAASKLAAGQRWITVHPNGNQEKGVPVLIQDDGGGTAHVIAGADGRLNMLKLNKVKSPEEYKALARERRAEERRKREEESKARAIQQAGLTEQERTKMREDEKARRDLARAAEKEKQEKIDTAKQDFLKSVAGMLGWEDRSDEIYENWQAGREGAVETLQRAIEAEDKDAIKAAKKDLAIIDKGYKQAMKSYEGNMMAAAKGLVRDIQKEAIEDAVVRAELEGRLGGKTGAEEAIRREKKGAGGKGFRTEYGESAEEAGLTAEALKEEKEELYQANIERLAEEVSPELAVMIDKGLKTRRAINEVKRELYEREELANRVSDLDQKAEVIGKWLALKQAAGEEKKEGAEPVQQTLDGEKEEQADDDLDYGEGLALEGSASSLFLQSLDDEAKRLETERQAAVNASLLEAIKANPNDATKWIANGHFEGFNRASLSVLKDEGIARDVTDVLGLRASAQLLARAMRASMSREDYADAAEAIQRFHADSSEQAAQQATDTASELFKKVEAVEADIARLTATTPDDLSMLKELNETRIGYLDEANRVLGQTLGSLEAMAMLGSVMKQGAPSTVDANLGAISSEDAVVRLRALGLDKDDYSIETINGDRVATIRESGLDKLASAADPEELAVQRDVDDIKRGVYDEEGWLPAGLVARPVESYEDPGVDPDVPEGEIDNQSIADDAEGMQSAQEAAHRALGDMPEGKFAFKSADDLSLQEQTDLRRYWESSVYKGSMAERFSVRQYQGEKGVTKAGAWQSYLASHGGMEDAAYEAIKADLVANHSEEDMFGMADPPAITKVNPANIESYRGRVEGASALFDSIDDLERSIADGTLTVDPERAQAELSRMKADLPGKLEELRKAQLRDHYHAWMSGHSAEEYAAGESGERFESSPWAEYVRMHGDTKRAQAAVLDTLRGRFVEKFATHYGRVTKKPLGTRREKIAESKGHLLGMLGKEERDSVIDKVQAELASAGASVANRQGGQFASGAWRDKALELIEKRRADAASQGSFFGEEELKQDDGTERTSIGKRAEAQLASMLGELGQSQLRGQKYRVNTMQADGVRQRAIKMFARTKRMNLTFGTGKGKTIISIGAFTDLHAQGKAKRAIFAVPSVVQSQFGNEVNVFCKPGAYKVASDPSLDREGRIAAMKDPSNHMVVLTHQSLRDDLVYLMSKRMDKSEEEGKAAFNAMSAPERAAYLGETLKEHGIDFSMLTVDEAHYATNRNGKEDSTLSNVLDALNRHTEYFMAQTATPVKNDVSEAFDMLNRVAPDRFPDRGEFMKRYGVDSDFARENLQRIIGRYNYASPTDTGVKANHTKETVTLSAAQQAAYDQVNAAFRRASRAKKAGGVDVEAVKMLSPNSFKDRPEADHEAIARQIQTGLGTMKEEALNRVVNQFDPADNAKVSRLVELIESKRYAADNPKTASKAGDRAPGVVFAHNLASVDALKNALAAKGLRVGVIQGTMSGADKEKVKVGYNPPNPAERQYDVLVMSDAGATGLNLQNSKYLINYDLTQTAWVKTQREGRINRMGQAHGEIDYHDLVSDTDHEATKWERIERKARLGSIFEDDPGAMDDTGLAAYVAAVRQERYNNGEEGAAA